jgi:hypothetical protein
MTNSSSLSNFKQIKPYERCKSPNFNQKPPANADVQFDRKTFQSQAVDEKKP